VPVVLRGHGGTNGRTYTGADDGALSVTEFITDCCAHGAADAAAHNGSGLVIRHDGSSRGKQYGGK
jgi:hypothetical protein